MESKTFQFQTDLQIVQEYAYKEDMNYPIRPSMEDCKNLIKFLLRKQISYIMVVLSIFLFTLTNCLIIAHFYIDDILKDGTTSFFAVLDGHGGPDVVNFCTKQMPTLIKDEFVQKPDIDIKEMVPRVFAKIDDQLKLVGASECGTTCCLTIIRIEKTGQQMMYIANLGDTRAVISVDGKHERVSQDHKATEPEEIERVQKSGGMIIRNRVSGQLAVTRALGDLDLKTQGVINVPDIKEMEITDKLEFLIMASDGLWDTISDEQAVHHVKAMQSAEEMAQNLVTFALQNGSRDNTSVLVLQFQ